MSQYIFDENLNRRGHSICAATVSIVRPGTVLGADPASAGSDVPSGALFVTSLPRRDPVFLGGVRPGVYSVAIRKPGRVDRENTVRIATTTDVVLGKPKADEVPAAVLTPAEDHLPTNDFALAVCGKRNVRVDRSTVEIFAATRRTSAVNRSGDAES